MVGARSRLLNAKGRIRGGVECRSFINRWRFVDNSEHRLLRSFHVDVDALLDYHLCDLSNLGKGHSRLELNCLAFMRTRCFSR